MRIPSDDPRVALMFAGRRWWFDLVDGRVPAATIYIPYGCPDWGETDGVRNAMCPFCSIPLAVQMYRSAFYEGAAVPDADHKAIFEAALIQLEADNANVHTLFVFNGGSFLAMPKSLQIALARKMAQRDFLTRVVIEARAALVTPDILGPVADILDRADKALTVRIGVETKDDRLRLTVLRKGHTRAALRKAVECMRALGVASGAYVLVGPAPGMASKVAAEEAAATVRWCLGADGDGLGMSEVYVGSTNVTPGSVLESHWKSGTFAPPSLWSLLAAIRAGSSFARRTHLLPFDDEPAPLAIPSNHTAQGIAPNLLDAKGCDLAFYAMFARYRETMDRAVLVPPDPHCSCRPPWWQD